MLEFTVMVGVGVRAVGVGGVDVDSDVVGKASNFDIAAAIEVKVDIGVVLRFSGIGGGNNTSTACQTKILTITSLIVEVKICVRDWERFVAQ